jgi:hypothetical protein
MRFAVALRYGMNRSDHFEGGGWGSLITSLWRVDMSCEKKRSEGQPSVPRCSKVALWSRSQGGGRRLGDMRTSNNNISVGELLSAEEGVILFWASTLADFCRRALIKRWEMKLHGRKQLGSFTSSITLFICNLLLTSHLSSSSHHPFFSLLSAC